LIVVLFLLGTAGWGAKRWLWPASDNQTEITAAVVVGDLLVVVAERGELESAKTITVKCEVEVEQIKIASVVPEGTAVKKGEEVLHFETDKLKRNLADQEIKTRQAVGKAEAARQELKVQENKAQGDIAKAQLVLTLAKLDHEKYLKGEFKVDVDDMMGKIKLAERELEEAEVQVKHYQNFVRKGFGTPEQLRLKELEVDKARNYLDRDKAKLEVLKTYTFKRQKAELTAKAKDALLDLERVKASTAATVAKTKADYEASEVVAKLEQEQLKRANKQLEMSTVRAPEDGILVYAQTRYWDPNSRIQVGGLVSFQQPLFKLPDLTNMQVKVRIHESKVKKIKVGQKADIRIDALPNQVLHGTVKNVATLSDSESPWMRGNVKEYETIVTIEDMPAEAGLKPGMTAEVGIKVNYLRGVLLVPVQAVAERDGRHFVYLPQPGGTECREVTVGETNEKFVEIKEGLEKGEFVSLDARARVAAETKADEQKPVSPGTEPQETKKK
jgi:RND family efflux transporter MFP subunit